MPNLAFENGKVPKQQLRCYCSKRPLLGVYGIDGDDCPYVHVKIFKQGKVYGEIVAHSGKISMRCRECYRWYRITIHQGATPPDVSEIVDEEQL